jgi:hypothetical protein
MGGTAYNIASQNRWLHRMNDVRVNNMKKCLNGEAVSPLGEKIAELESTNAKLHETNIELAREHSELREKHDVLARDHDDLAARVAALEMPNQS